MIVELGFFLYLIIFNVLIFREIVYESIYYYIQYNQYLDVKLCKIIIEFIFLLKSNSFVFQFIYSIFIYKINDVCCE